MNIGAASGIRTRDLLVGNEASYSSTMAANFWLGRRESNPRSELQRLASYH